MDSPSVSLTMISTPTTGTHRRRALICTSRPARPTTGSTETTRARPTMDIARTGSRSSSAILACKLIFFGRDPKQSIAVLLLQGWNYLVFLWIRAYIIVSLGTTATFCTLMEVCIDRYSSTLCWLICCSWQFLCLQKCKCIHARALYVNCETQDYLLFLLLFFC